MKTLPAKSDEAVFREMLEAIVLKKLNSDYAHIWEQMPKNEDEDCLFEDFVNLCVDVADLMDAVLCEVGLTNAWVYFCEDSKTSETDLFQLFIDDGSILEQVEKATGIKPRAILLRSECFKQWHFYFERIEDLAEHIANFLAPAFSAWLKICTKAA